MALILEVTKSAYYGSYETFFGKVVAGMMNIFVSFFHETRSALLSKKQVDHLVRRIDQTSHTLVRCYLLWFFLRKAQEILMRENKLDEEV